MWLYRIDIGGTSQHRWDHSGILNMVVRHSTCMKAVLPRSICRNCNMKEYWRVKCGDPDDTFFIMCEHTVSLDAATQILRHSVSLLSPLLSESAKQTAYWQSWGADRQRDRAGCS